MDIVHCFSETEFGYFVRVPTFLDVSKKGTAFFKWFEGMEKRSHVNGEPSLENLRWRSSSLQSGVKLRFRIANSPNDILH